MATIADCLDLAKASMERGKGQMIRQVIPCFWGPSGVGKTQQILTWAAKNDYRLPNNSSLPVGSMESPADLIGMQDRVDGKTVYCLPDWFDFTHPRIMIFLDEINRGNNLLLQALIPLLGEYMVGPHPIPAHVMLVAAANPPTDEYDVNELDTALLNRLWHVPIESKVAQWVGWAEGRLHNDLVDFVDSHESTGQVTQHVIALGGDSTGSGKAKPWVPKLSPSGKKWEMVGLGYSPSMKKSMMKALFDGLLGSGVFEAFYPFQKEKERPLNPGDIITGYTSVQGYILKWGSRRYNRVDLLDLTLQRLARHVKPKKRSLSWVYTYVERANKGLISDNAVLNHDYPLISDKREPDQRGFLQFLNDLSSENLRSLQVLLEIGV